MVKFSLSVVAMAASLASLVAAAPYCRDDMTVFRPIETLEVCPGLFPKEGSKFMWQDRQQYAFLGSKSGTGALYSWVDKNTGVNYFEEVFCLVKEANAKCDGKSTICATPGTPYYIRVDAKKDTFLNLSKDGKYITIDDDKPPTTQFILGGADHQKTVRIVLKDNKNLALNTAGRGERIAVAPVNNQEHDQQFTFVVPIDSFVSFDM